MEARGKGILDRRNKLEGTYGSNTMAYLYKKLLGLFAEDKRKHVKQCEQ